MRRTIVSLSIAAVLAICAVPALAQATYTGSLLWDSCLNANLNWAATDTRIDWTVSQAVAGGPWTYSYTLTVADDPEISHWILELTPGVTIDSIISSNWDLDADDFKTYTTGDPSNPALPCNIYGVKFDEVDALSETFTFTTNIAPVWGDFYAKGGATTRVFNDTFCDADPINPPSDNTVNCKLLRPDSGTGVIPEPSSIILAMLGALPMVGYKLRRRQ